MSENLMDFREEGNESYAQEGMYRYAIGRWTGE